MQSHPEYSVNLS